MDQERTREPLKVSIIGLGLIGGSLGLALRAARPSLEIVGYDTDPSVVEAALAAGAISSGAVDPKSCAAGSDFVFIATPLPLIAKVLAEIGEAVDSQTIVTDVGSTKSTIVESAERELPAGVNFIGGHPMAGSDQGGFQSATSDLFREAVYVLTPTSSTSPGAFQGLHSLLTSLGARVMALSPEKHDEVVAAVSHLPHVLAASLVNLVASVDEGVENRMIFAAGGFRDTTRIAGSNPDLWVEICLDNQQAILESIDKFQLALGAARDDIAAENRDGVRMIFASAKERRLSLSAGTPTLGELREVAVIVSDRPGVISQIAMTFGEIGINIEDIQIVHLSDDSGVINLIVNDDPNFDRAVTQLREYGFDVVVRK